MSIKTQEMLYERVSFSPRPRSRIVWKTAWQLEQDDELTLSVFEHGKTRCKNEDQEEGRFSVEYGKTHCRDEDQDGTRSNVKHGKTRCVNKDREETGSSDNKHGEPPCRNETESEPKVDYRILGILHATVEQQDDARRKLISKLVYLDKNHPNREVLIKYLQQKHTYNPFSEETK